jgi:hypothetical protein
MASSVRNTVQLVGRSDRVTRTLYNINYFCPLKNKLGVHNFHVFFCVWVFNTHGFDGKRGLSLPNCNSYTERKEDSLYKSTCLLNLHQYVDVAAICWTWFYLFSVTPGLLLSTLQLWSPIYHPRLVIDMLLAFANWTQNHAYSYSKLGILSSLDWSVACDTISIDAAVPSLNAIVQDTMEQAILRRFITKSKFRNWFPCFPRSYIKNENYFTDFFKTRNIAHYYCKLVKATIKSDVLKCSDYNLK